jgi:hypothetical protein
MPDEQPLTGVRILNAVSNVPVLLIYMDGKLFDRAYYDLPEYLAVGSNFTYRSTFISDGSTMRAGQHHIVAIGSGGQASGDTVLQANYILYDHLQSIECIGKLRGTPAQKPTTIYLDDGLRNQVSHSYARFIDAVPDINPDPVLNGVDVYFNSVAIPPPNVRIHYGKISDAQGGDAGTGLSANDYYMFPDTVPGLIITPIGDTTQADYIADFSHTLQTNSLLETIVVRGEAKPSGSDPTISTVLIEDGGEGGKTYSTELQTFEIRLVNASHYNSLSLMIANPTDQNDSIPRTTTEEPYPTQEKVTNITEDSVSNFMALNPNVPYYKFWFAHSDNNKDTVLRFTTDQHDTLTRIVIPTLVVNDRYTFVAINTKPHDTGNASIGLLELFDTVSAPSNLTMGRVRFVNTTADYTVNNFTFAGQNISSMAQRDVTYADAPVGPISFHVTGGTATGTITFDLTQGTPATVFFFPSDGSDTIPYRISTQ